MTNLFRSRTTRFVSIVLGLFLFYAVGVATRQRFGIGIFVDNQSGETLREVIVKVEGKGKAYRLPDLAPGDRRRVFVQPVGESRVDIHFKDASGKPRVEPVVGYVESGYCGSAEVTILPDGKATLKENIDTTFCRRSWLAFISAKNSIPPSNPKT